MRSKNSFTATVAACMLLCATACTAQSQNYPPQVYTPRYTIDADQQIMRIEFALHDGDNDQVEIKIQLSNDSGLIITPPASSLSGDVGYPVTVKDDNVVLWHYDVETLRKLGPGHHYLRVIADDRERPEVDMQALLDAVTADTLRARLREVTGVRNFNIDRQHIRDVVNRIMSTFVSSVTPYEPMRWFQQFDYSGYTATNCIADKSGITSPDSVIIIGAHFDTVEESPGADDNGSSVVGLMEIIRVLKGLRFDKTIRFAFFDLEEEGLVGSRRYVSTIPEHENILGMIDLEMIGYASSEPNSQKLPAGFNLLFPAQYDSIASNEFRGDFITNIANQNSVALMSAFEGTARRHVPSLRVISAAVPGNGAVAPDFRRSDHAPFWDAGIPAIMLTDGANFRNPNYHKSSDTLETINFEFMRDVVRATLASIIELGGVSHAGTNRTGFGITISDVGIPVVSAAHSMMLGQNLPNPFSTSTTIRGSLQS
jgi:hypothetical protein